MCLNSLSSSELIALSSSLAVTLGENLSAEEATIIAVFLTSLADNFSIIATKKATMNSD